MKKKIIAVIIAALLLIIGGVIASGSASATEDNQKCWDKVLVKEAYDKLITPAKDAYDEQVLVTPAVEAVPAQDAVTQTIYIYKQKETGKLKEKYNSDWNPGNGWELFDQREDVIQEATPGTDAIPATYKTVHHDAVEAVYKHIPAKYDHVEVPCDPIVAGEITLKWRLPETTKTDGTLKLWPQTPYNGNFEPECKTYTIQVDTYRYKNQQELDAINAFDDDGFLRKGEDSDYVVAWDLITVDGNPDLCETPCPPDEEEPPVVTPPTEQPPATDTPKPPAEEVKVPVKTVVHEVVTPVSDERVLPATGGDIPREGIAVALILICVGSVLVGASRINRSTK